MFQNTGKKLKSIAIIMFLLMTVASIILAFVIGFRLDNVWLILLFLIGGPAFAYIGCLILHGFGSMVIAAESQNISLPLIGDDRVLSTEASSLQSGDTEDKTSPEIEKKEDEAKDSEPDMLKFYC